VEKLLDGNPGHRPLTQMQFPGAGGRPVCPDFLRGGGKQGVYPSAEDSFAQVVDWLETTGCLPLIPPDYIAEYVLLKTRWFEAEARTDLVGFLAKHPTTGQPVTNPVIKAGLEYLKAADVAWQKIWRIVVQNSGQEIRADSPNDSVMGAILQHGAQKIVPKKTRKEPDDAVRPERMPDDPGGAVEPGEI
jgi:hypothetical protein